MSKKDSANTVMNNEENTTKEASAPNWKEIRENLVLQLKNHLEQVEHHRTMATKAQGAIEVGDQMHPDEVGKEENK